MVTGRNVLQRTVSTTIAQNNSGHDLMLTRCHWGWRSNSSSFSEWGKTAIDSILSISHLFACGSQSISTMTLHWRNVSCAAVDEHEYDCGDRSPMHRSCHSEDRQVQLELPQHQRVCEHDDRWPLAPMMLWSSSDQWRMYNSTVLCQLQFFKNSFWYFGA